MKRQLLKTGISWLALLVFMGIFRPSGLPVVVLIVPFVLLFVACLNLWVSLQLLYGRYLTRHERPPKHKRLGATVCGSLVLLIILQSLGQLTLRDAGTVAAIAVIGYVYMARTRSRADAP
jgi:hypothetical protein